MLKIMVANDDGINAIGIQTLISRLAQDYPLYVVAPELEQSAKGHSLTLHQPIRVEEVDFPQTAHSVKAYAVSGTPTDCIKLGLNALLDFQPDLLVSGINHGPNLGSDVVYSGTVSAAMEGAINGIPSIAVSLMNGYVKGADFSAAADFIAQFLPTFLKSDVPAKTLLNINVPAGSLKDMAGVRLTSLATRMYTDTYDKRLDPRGKTYYWLAGEVVDNVEEPADSDVLAVRQNYISMTPVTFDMTHWKYLESHHDKFSNLLS